MSDARVPAAASGKALDHALAQVERHYSHNLRVHGPTAQGVGWNSEASQRLRFEQFTQLFTPPPAEPITVNDLGCGCGALLEYLDALQTVRVARYHGYDISEAMIESARARTDDRAVFHHHPRVTEQADYSVVSGTFNVKGEADDESWDSYVRETLLDVAAHSRRGFAFNLLTTVVDFRKDDLFYADPRDYLSFCMERISPYVVLLHDYPLYEWTILVRTRESVSGGQGMARVPSVRP